MDFVERIEELFRLHGRSVYEDARREPVTALAHALQCAQLAEWADAEPSLVAAALLHDVGHFIAMDPAGDEVDDVHELRAVPFLAAELGPSVIEPIRLHVQAKRFLVATDNAYAAALSPASVHSLRLQGGSMCVDEMRLFVELPFSRQAVSLRRWDDMAKEPSKRTPSLDYYLRLVEQLSRREAARRHIEIGPLSAIS
ncbi:HD domain-containing protein [soil metagenome]